MTTKTTRTVLNIVGMKGTESLDVVQTALEQVRGVQRVEISLFRSVATVDHDAACDVVVLLEAIQAVGFGVLLVL